MRPGDFRKYVAGSPMRSREASQPQTILELQLEIATAKLENTAGRLAACTNEWRRSRLSEELDVRRRAVERLEAKQAEAKP